MCKLFKAKNKHSDEPLEDSIRSSMNQHSHWIDSALYNGGTVIVILLTGAATFTPDFGEPWTWVARILTGIAACWIAIERALNFGARWRFHVEMKNEYKMVLDKYNIHKILKNRSNKEQAKSLKDILTSLDALRHRESAIPGGVGRTT